MKINLVFSKIGILAVGFGLAIGANYLYAAWTGPGNNTAPAGNVSTPINVSSTDQIKNGGALGVAALSWGASNTTNGLSTDQGGAIELGGQNAVKNPITNGAPYIDFHFGTGAAQDYNMRLINSASNQLTFSSQAAGSVLTINGSGYGLDLNSAFKLDGTAASSSANEIYFADGGQIRSSDNNHRIIFDRSNNKIDFIEYGDINISAGATTGAVNSTMVVKGSGNVGIGTAAPANKLSVNGVIQSTSGGYKFPDGTTQTTAAGASVGVGTQVYICPSYCGGAHSNGDPVDPGFLSTASSCHYTQVANNGGSSDATASCTAAGHLEP